MCGDKGQHEHRVTGFCCFPKKCSQFILKPHRTGHLSEMRQKMTTLVLQALRPSGSHPTVRSREQTPGLNEQD